MPLSTGLCADGGQVVAIEVDVEDSDRDLAVFERRNFGREALRQRNSAPPDADKCQLVEVFRVFEDFMRQAYESAIDLRGAHELRFDLRQSHRTDCSV